MPFPRFSDDCQASVLDGVVWPSSKSSKSGGYQAMCATSSSLMYDVVTGTWREGEEGDWGRKYVGVPSIQVEGIARNQWVEVCIYLPE